MFIPSYNLRNLYPYKEKEGTKICLLNDSLIAKIFQFPNEALKVNYYEKYKRANGIPNIKGLYKPIDCIESETGFCGYVEPIIPGTISGNITDFASYYNEKKNELTLDVICDYMLNVIRIMKECHEANVIVPDLCSEGNVLIDKNTLEVFFTDYQGMQVKDVSSSSYSSFYSIDPIIISRKYIKGIKGNFWTTNIDWYIVTIRFLYYATKINLPKMMVRMGDSFEAVLNLTNLSKTYFGECIRVLYDLEKENMDVTVALEDLKQNYEITPLVSGQPRQFIKKIK